MPVGVIVNCLAISLGGLIGALARERIPEKIKQNLPVIFSVCAMALGITLIGFISLLVLFSMSAGFIIGSLYEGMTGDTTLLVIKSILDFFTAMIFATTIGYLVMLISIPALIIGTAFFALAFLILPYLNEALIADFTAGSGIINL